MLLCVSVKIVGKHIGVRPQWSQLTLIIFCQIVNMHLADFQLPSYVNSTFHIRAMDSGVQSILGVIRQLDRLLVGAESVQRCRWAEGLLIPNRHILLDSRKYCWFE